MPSSKEDVLEPHSRHIGSAQLFINADASWSVGPSTNALVKVKFGSIQSIDDDTFGFSAVSVESDGKGGYRLFVRADAQNDTIVEVAVNASGEVDPASVKALTQDQLFAVEDEFKVDLNDSGGFGAGSVLLEGGSLNRYMDGVGAYQVGSPGATPKSLSVGGQALTDELLPPGWEIIEQVPGAGGAYVVYAQDPGGAVFAANFSSDGSYTGGRVLSAAELEELETGQGLDIDEDGDLPAPAGWTGGLQDPAIRQLVDSALTPTPAALGSFAFETAQNVPAPGSTMTYTELVAMCKTIIQSHKDAGNTPMSAAEVASLQDLAARGKTVFASASSATSEYLNYVFSKMVGGSDANRFYTGGEALPSELGSLTAGTSLAQFEKLVDKWLLGGDLPNTATGGDTATGNAQAVKPSYSKSSGSLFVDGVALADVNQGSAGDCYLIAVLGGLAGSKADAIQAMVVENPTIDGVRTWGVRFYDAQGKTHWVTVDDRLPTRLNDPSKLAYAGPSSKDLNGEIWVPLIEKAYAQANTLGILPRAENNGKNSYMAVEGGQADPLPQLLGGKTTMYSVGTTPDKVGVAALSGNPFVTVNGINGTDPAAVTGLETLLKTAVNAGKLIWIGVTTSVKDSFGNQLLVGSHAHFALDADPADPNNSSLLVYNPWGLQALPDPAGPTPGNFISPAPYTIAQLIGIPGLDLAILDVPGG